MALTCPFGTGLCRLRRQNETGSAQPLRGQGSHRREPVPNVAAYSPRRHPIAGTTGHTTAVKTSCSKRLKGDDSQNQEKYSIRRHPGESRGPVSEISVDPSIKHWIPAFAGMTVVGGYWLVCWVALVLTFAPPLRRFEHDFVTIAGLTLSDPARGPLRAGRSQSSRHLGRQSR